MSLVALTIKWFGQACFLISMMHAPTVVIDPYHNIGYKPLDVTAQVVFVSHEHADHNAVELVKGKPVAIHPLPANKKIEKSVAEVGNEGVNYTAIQSYHDAEQGKSRGLNTIRVIEENGLRICHLGDLGTLLTREQIKEIGHIDVLLIPVGGVYTIDGKTAIKVVHQLNDPKIVVPMHYKTPALKIPLQTADEFLKGFKNVKHVDKLEISKSSLPKESTVYVLKY